MITKVQQEKAAKSFVSYWKDKGYEKGECQPFWLGLLRDVFGVEKPEQVIEFESQVKLDHTSFMDGYIHKTHVLIEQKSKDKSLYSPIKQSGGSFLTPFQQAKRYSADLPYSERPRWIVTSNFKSFLIYDMEQPNKEPEEILLEDLAKEYYRLSFLVEEQSEHIRREMEISMKAGEIIGEIYDELLKQYLNPTSAETLRSLNILCVRIVFCLYAEDAGVFGGKSMFYDYLSKFKAGEGDMRRALKDLFEVLNTPIPQRDPYLPVDLKAFPYCNGGLFSEKNIEIPYFNEKIASLLLKNASLDFDWSEISPTIFGAVFESTLNPKTRRKGGMHYTSIENIHKVIDPLFLDDLKHEFSDIRNITVEKERMSSLKLFQDKIASLTFLDPACGSGNFLTETYLSLRRLENQAIVELTKGQTLIGFEEVNPIKVDIHQFYGIEINDFAVDVATTALWIAESQMMSETSKIIDRDLDVLPLKTYKNIKKGNALRENWEYWDLSADVPTIVADKTNLYVLPQEQSPIANEDIIKYGEINLRTKEILVNAQQTKPHKVNFNYIMGNPPFVGARMMAQGSEQKRDIEDLFGKIKDVQDLDYVCGWYKKAAQLIKGTDTQVGFVSTNSICQGAQVPILWNELLNTYDITIDFAHPTFKWNSESSEKASVYCVIVGFSYRGCKNKRTLYGADGTSQKSVDNINPYLLPGPNVLVEARKDVLCDAPKMNFGNQPRDGGFLILTELEKNELLLKDATLKMWIRPYMGADEFINGKKRYCLWLKDASPAIIKQNKVLYERVQAVRRFREKSQAKTTNGYAKVPHLFAQITQPDNVPYLVIPRTSSERRYYIPIDFIEGDTIASDAVQIIPNASLFHFGVLTSFVHQAWMRKVCGRLKSDYRYSKEIVYNNFPWPQPTYKQKIKIETTAKAILDARLLFPDCSMADLYDDNTMPPLLRKAHKENDKAVMAAYGFITNLTETECVTELMKLYQKLADKKC